jgi:hypothetical protein
MATWVNPYGESTVPLATDTAYAGAINAKDIIAIASGTHGVEGFCGSLVQAHLLSTGVTLGLPAGVGLLLIHAINPFGFAFIRRVDEDNVDVNRNFIDHSRPPPANPDYDGLADAIALGSLSVATQISSFARLVSYQITHGGRSLQRAVSGGQYSHPRGLFYGGKRQSWSNQTLRLIVDRYLRYARRVVFIDVHTGLGKYGAAEIIHRHILGAPATARVTDWWGKWARSRLTNGSVSTADSGTTVGALPLMLPDLDVTSVTLEFGTFPMRAVFRALRRENWLYHHGSVENKRAGSIKAELLRAFFPDSPKWRSAVLRQSGEILRRGIDGFSRRR